MATLLTHPNLPDAVLEAPTEKAAKVWRTRGWVDKADTPDAENADGTGAGGRLPADGPRKEKPAKGSDKEGTD